MHNITFFSLEFQPLGGGGGGGGSLVANTIVSVELIHANSC